MTIDEVAKICHDTNKSLCETQGDWSQLPWEIAPEWQKKSAIISVIFILTNPKAPASATHYEWAKAKIRDGWRYGIVKDEAKKEHPYMVEFHELPQDQKAKDYLFHAICLSLSRFVILQEAKYELLLSTH